MYCRMADVCYNTSSFSSLAKTLSRLVNLSCNTDRTGSHSETAPPLVLLGYKQRDEAERTFWDLALSEANLKFEKISEKKGAGGAEVEVWIGSVIGSGLTG